MRYCKTCLSPDTRPNARFNAQGICIACTYSEASRDIAYEARLRELREIVRRLTQRRKYQEYDCIVGVSGGKDSTRQALWVREKLGLTPLLVCVAYPPRQVSQVGVDNLSNLISRGFDCVMLGPAPQTSRDLMREAFFRFTNIFRATEMVLFAGVPKMAVAHDIKLILWGENPALQVGDAGSLGESIWDGNNIRNLNTLAGGELGWMVDKVGRPESILPYQFPDVALMREKLINTVFLGPAWSNWSISENSAFAMPVGLHIRKEGVASTGDLMGTSMLDEEWATINMMLKYYKLGFGRASDYVNEEIRAQRLTREEGAVLVKRYDGICDDKYVESFCRYVSISVDEFWAQVARAASPVLFESVPGKQRPQPLFTPGVDRG
ncbi:MAG: N-acetyl sugar amidotransferase [Bdellovibrionales bacterium]|nr:N-acetyl sugar amidotransferase [Ramlibacter sp.]